MRPGDAGRNGFLQSLPFDRFDLVIFLIDSYLNQAVDKPRKEDKIDPVGNRLGN
jgi:hypothetical protein